MGGILGIPLNTHDFDEDRSESSFTPTVILEWDATDTTMAYVNLSSGFKAGGFDGQCYQGRVRYRLRRLHRLSGAAPHHRGTGNLSLLTGEIDLPSSKPDIL